MVFVIATAFSVLFTYISSKIKKYDKLNKNAAIFFSKAFAFFSFLPPTAVMAVRYNVGEDYIPYRNYFYSMPEYVEIGYKFLNNMLKNLVDDPQSVFIVSSVIICGCYFYMIYKESVSPVYSVLLFVVGYDYFIAMSSVRQYIATAIMMLAFPHIKEKQIFKSLIFLIVAFLFHKSIIIFIPLYILYIIEISPLISGAAIIVTFLISNIIVKYIYPILIQFNFYSGYFINERANLNGEANLTVTVVNICFFILLSYEYKNAKQYKEFKLLYSGVVLSLFIAALCPVMPTNFGRISFHMKSLIDIYMPFAIEKFNLKISKISVRNAMSVAILAAYSALTIYNLLRNTYHIFPYQTIWDK